MALAALTYRPEADKVVEPRTFTSTLDASTALGIPYGFLRRWLKRGLTLEEVARKYDARIARGGLGASKPVTVFGKSYPSYRAAAKAHGFTSKKYERRRLKRKFPPDLCLEDMVWKHALNLRQHDNSPIPVDYKGRTFASAREAGPALGISHITLLKLGREIGSFTNQTFQDALRNKLERKGHGGPKPIAVRGVLYPSLRAAAEALDLKIKRVESFRLKNHLTNEEVFEELLRKKEL